MSRNRDHLGTASDGLDVELSPIPLLEAARSREDGNCSPWGGWLEDHGHLRSRQGGSECLQHRNSIGFGCAHN